MILDEYTAAEHQMCSCENAADASPGHAKLGAVRGRPPAVGHRGGGASA